MLDSLFTGNTLFFSVPAVAGTLFFLIRMGLSFVGLDLDGPEFDSSGLDPTADPHHSSALFKVLSIQSIGAFVMGFGWGGLGGLNGAGWGFGGALVSAIVGGVLMVWLMTWLLKIVHDLQSSGTLPINAALNATGEVYANIPAHGEGTGQVRLVVQQRQRIYNAVSLDAPLPTSTQVRVVKVNENNTVTVAPME